MMVRSECDKEGKLCVLLQMTHLKSKINCKQPRGPECNLHGGSDGNGWKDHFLCIFLNPVRLRR